MQNHFTHGIYKSQIYCTRMVFIFSFSINSLLHFDDHAQLYFHSIKRKKIKLNKIQKKNRLQICQYMYIILFCNSIANISPFFSPQKLIEMNLIWVLLRVRERKNVARNCNRSTITACTADLKELKQKNVLYVYTYI